MCKSGVVGFVLIVLIFLTPNFFSQPPAMVPPNLQRQPRNPDEAAYRQLQIQRSMEAQQQNIMRSGEMIARNSALPRGERPLVLTRAERKRYEALMAPNIADLEFYKDFLHADRTGIFRLFPNSDCVNRGLIRVDGQCANHVPGGSSNKFRSGAITPDIHFNNGILFAEGFFSQQVLVNLGDVPIAEVNLETTGIPFLTTFEPAVNFTVAQSQYKDLAEGIEHDRRQYSNRTQAAVNTTYAVRIVAYRNTNNLLSRFGHVGTVLNEDFEGFSMIRNDNRTDIVVAFRIIRQEEDGNITIVWKELSRKKSPVLNFEKKEKMQDFR